MPIKNITLRSELPRSQYLRPNLFVGMFVDFLVSSGNITVISDNNPVLDSQQRAIVLQVGDYPHFFRARSAQSSIDDIALETLSLDGTQSVTAFRLVFDSISVFRMLYSDRILLVYPVGSTDALISGVKGEFTDRWYVAATKASISAQPYIVYPLDSNSGSYGLTGFSFSTFADSEGRYVAYPCIIATASPSSTFIDRLPQILFVGNGGGFIGGGTYTINSKLAVCGTYVFHTE